MLQRLFPLHFLYSSAIDLSLFSTLFLYIFFSRCILILSLVVVFNWLLYSSGKPATGAIMIILCLFSSVASVWFLFSFFCFYVDFGFSFIDFWLSNRICNIYWFSGLLLRFLFAFAIEIFNKSR